VLGLYQQVWSAPEFDAACAEHAYLLAVPMPYADLQKLEIDATRLRALPPRERYVFALTGHVFNEIMSLQKLLEAAKPKRAIHEFETEGRVGLSILLIKLLAGKVHEAMDYLTRHSVTIVLSRDYFSSSEQLHERWDSAVARYKALGWLKTIRNTASFHYMNASQWKDLSNDDLCSEAHAIVGKRYAQTFFHWQDIVANFSMMKVVNADAPFDGFATMLDELGELCGDLCECLAEGLQRYMWDQLCRQDALKEVVAVETALLEEAELPYFYANRKA
jgi:hypothetical protein